MTKAEIKQRYITLAKLSHPDSPSYDPSIDFSSITSAYKTLSDSKLRRRYDREVAAEEFKGDVVAYAEDMAKEYGPVAKKLYEDWALPFLKRTTASTVAGWSAIGDVASGGESSGAVEERTRTMGSGSGSSSLSDVVREQTLASKNGNRSGALEDFGKAFQRVIEAGRNATRLIDGTELQEKSLELRQR
jgi:curved DNA-binding protein CbpA